MNRVHWQMYLGLLAVIWGSVISSSCATRVKGLYCDPGFTYPAVVSGRMVVGGVTSALNPLPPATRNLYGNILSREFLDEQENFRILPSSRLASLIGSENLNRLLDEYRVYGQLSDAWLQELRPAVREARYLMLARIEKDDIQNERSDETVYDKDGKSVEDRRKITLKTERTVGASLGIYDLDRGIEVWRGTVEKSATRKTNYETNEWGDLASVVVDAVLDKDVRSSRTDYPTPVSLDDLLNRIFEGFAENMPEPE